MLLATIIGVALLVFYMNTANDWSDSPDPSGAATKVINPYDRNDSRLSPLPSNDPSNGRIAQAFVETDAIDPGGYVGVRVHAKIDAAGMSGVRFAAHFVDQSQNHVFSSDPRFSDSNKQAASAVPLPASDDPIEVTAFIPYTAFDLGPGKQRLEMLPALFDSADHPLVIGRSVPFDWDRGSVYVTRVRYDPAEVAYRDSTLTVSIRSHRRQTIDLAVIVRFKDARGLFYPGHVPFVGANGERAVTSDCKMPPATIVDATIELPIRIPATLTPPGTTAEVMCYDRQSRTWLTHAVSFKLP